jgi:hypothetical protein
MKTHHYFLRDDGTLDTVIVDCESGEEHRFCVEFAMDYRDPETGDLHFERFMEGIGEDLCDD